MLQFLSEHFDEYETALAEINKNNEPKFEHLRQAKRLYLNRRDSKLYVDEYNSKKVQLLHYLDTLRNQVGGLPNYVNFMYQDNMIINYNFPLRLIIIYMGAKFNEDYLEMIKSHVPNPMGFKVINNEFKSSFRSFSRNDYDYVHDNIMKIISFYPMEFESIIKEYILRSYDFNVRNKSMIRLRNLHVIMNLIQHESKFVKSKDGGYLINFKSAYPHQDLLINNEAPFVDVYNRKGETLACFENDVFIILGIINISIYIIKDNYDLDIDECYNTLLTTCIERYYQTSPSNNNSPSSE
jgi:hypothetical protein